MPEPRESSPAVLAGLGAVVLGVPLAVLPRASGPYDDPKAWALPLIVAVTALAWAASRRTPRGASDRLGAGVRLVVLACVAWWALTTLTSIAPVQSLLGSFGRGMGLVTMAAPVVLFFLLQAESRSRVAARALVDVALLGSVPVCAIALGQYWGWNSLPVGWDPAVRAMVVRSTLGTHIFLGSYLVVLIPLAAARLEWAWRDAREAGLGVRPTRAEGLRAVLFATWAAGATAAIALGSHWPWLWWALVPWGVAGAVVWARVAERLSAPADTAFTAALVGVVLVVQVVAVILSRGRGAFIAMVLGLSVTGFAVLLRRRARKTLAVAALGLVALTVFLVLLNREDSPLTPLRKVRLLSRLADMGNLKHGSPGWVRVQMWTAITKGWRDQLAGRDVVAEVSSPARGVIGYGPETQLIVLEPLTWPYFGQLIATGRGWRARYVFDRAHNVGFDQLVTTGLVGAVLFVTLGGVLLVVGILRIRTSSTAGETAIRLGALGAMLAHIVDGLVGIMTAAPWAIFWLAAALLTAPPWTAGPAVVDAPPGPAVSRLRRASALTLLALVVALVGWAGARWLLASIAVADGTRHAVVGRLPEAYRDFRRAAEHVPWLPLPAESAASAALRLASGETDPRQRLELLQDAESLLARSREYALGGAESWLLSAQVAFAQVQLGERGRLSLSHEAFANAQRLRPDDARMLAQSGWAWLEGNNLAKARQDAERAVALDPRDWLAWAVLARALQGQGDLVEASAAAITARRLVPVNAQSRLEAVLPPTQKRP